MAYKIKQDDEFDITFFIPCYNEEENIVRTIETIVSAAQETTFKYEILIIDDHSQDKTVDVIEDFMKMHCNIPIQLERNKINCGLGYNYVEGAFLGKGKYYMAVFGDNSEPKESLLTVIKKLGSANIVVPYFGRGDSRPITRVLISRTFVALVNFISGHALRYYNGPVLHLRYNVMRWHSNTLGFAYQAELITQLLDNGASYTEVEIPNCNRKRGVSKAFTFKNFLSISHSLLQIFLRRIRRIFFKI